MLAVLESRYGAELVNHGGLLVTTTLDLDLQRQAEEAVRQQLAELARQTREEGAPDFNLHNAALVALNPPTGQILAMVGSADYWDTSIDGAVNVSLANRQPGSAIKPVTYAAAFASGLTAASVFNDVQTTFITREGQPYSPQNYDRLWHGPILVAPGPGNLIQHGCGPRPGPHRSARHDGNGARPGHQHPGRA